MDDGGRFKVDGVTVRGGASTTWGAGNRIGEVTSGLLGPTINQCVAMGYIDASLAALGTPVVAIVRGKPVPMVVSAMPFVPTNYYRG